MAADRGGARRIDLHQHFAPPPSLGLGSASAAVDTGWRYPTENRPWSASKSIAFMDRLEVETTILSLTGSPGGSGVGPENRKFARSLNEFAAQEARDHPGRFGFFANLPIPSDADAALAELAYALDELGADGVNLTSSYGHGDDARYVADDAFDPVWEELDRRAAVVFLHGDKIPSSNRFPSTFVPVPLADTPSETFKAAADLVTRGKKRRWPKVKIVLAHAGGSTPYLAARCAGLARQQGCPLTPEEMLEDFASFYYEVALAGLELNLRTLEHFVAPEQVLFGTDFPSVSYETARWYTDQVDDCYVEQPLRLRQVMRDNALALFPRLGATSSRDGGALDDS